MRPEARSMKENHPLKDRRFAMLSTELVLLIGGVVSAERLESTLLEPLKQYSLDFVVTHWFSSLSERRISRDRKPHIWNEVPLAVDQWLVVTIFDR
eukprot:5783458-Amphidinium_carterae.2